MKQFTIHVALTDAQMEKLTEIKSLRDAYRKARNFAPVKEGKHTLHVLLDAAIVCSLDSVLDEQIAFYKEEPQAERDGEAGDRNPSPEAAPEEPDADGEEEELVHITFSITEGNMIHDALFDAGQRVLARRFPHTWVFPVEDESLFSAVWEGDTPMTLTEEEGQTIVSALYARAFSKADAGYITISDELFNLARRICGDDARQEEPETLISVRDASGVVREVTLDEMEEMQEAAQGIYAGEPPEPDFEPDAPEEPDADGEEEEPETVSNAEEKPSPLIKDNSDGYVYYLEHGHWPPDDEVLAGADVPCTGDYGLSDCLVVTQSTLDFVDAFFT